MLLVWGGDQPQPGSGSGVAFGAPLSWGPFGWRVTWLWVAPVCFWLGKGKANPGTPHRGDHGDHSSSLFPSPEGIQLPFAITGSDQVTLPESQGRSGHPSSDLVGIRSPFPSPRVGGVWSPFSSPRSGGLVTVPHHQQGFTLPSPTPSRSVSQGVRTPLSVLVGGGWGGCVSRAMPGVPRPGRAPLHSLWGWGLTEVREKKHPVTWGVASGGGKISCCCSDVRGRVEGAGDRQMNE